MSNPNQEKARVFTSWNTLVNFDVVSGQLRHGTWGDCPNNALFITDGDRGHFVFEQAGNCLHPIACGIHGCSVSGRATDFELVRLENATALRSKDLYLCAEPDGHLTLSRSALGNWERFALARDLPDSPDGNALCSPLPSDGGDAILLLVSLGVSDFVENLLASIRRVGEAQSTISIALPRNAFEEVSSVASRWVQAEYLILEDISDTDCSWLRSYQEYGTEHFGRFMTLKWTAIRSLLKRGFQRVTYSDVDVAWMRNPMPMIRAALARYDVAIQTEGRDHFPPRCCAGFMSFRNSAFAHNLLDHLQAAYAELVRQNPNLDDQQVFNYVIANSTNVIHHIWCLSEQLFATGLMAGLLALHDDTLDKLLVRRIEPMLFHANWTIGTENKRALLQRTGNWLIGNNTRPR